MKEEIKSVNSVKEVSKDLEKSTETEVMTQVEDNFKAPIEDDVKKESEEESSKDDKTQEPGAEDNSVTTVEDTAQEKSIDPQAWYQERINEIGLARATKEFKIKFK